jgi:hypothetical protein
MFVTYYYYNIINVRQKGAALFHSNSLSFIETNKEDKSPRRGAAGSPPTYFLLTENIAEKEEGCPLLLSSPLTSPPHDLTYVIDRNIRPSVRVTTL